MPQKVCRTCLELFDNDSQLICINNTQQPGQKLKKKLEACVPEVVINRVADSVVCQTCVTTLSAAYSFKVKCMENERRLCEYMTEKKVDSVDLFSFLQDMTNGDVSEDDVTFISNGDDTHVSNGGGTHIPNCLLPNNSIKCSVCNLSFESVAQIKEHINSHGDEPIKCGLCHFQSKSKQALTDHMKSHEIFKCIQCSFSTNDRQAHTEHCATHAEVKYHTCNMCPFKTIRQYSLNRHLRTHQFQCTTCPFKASDEAALLKHKEKHAIAKPFNCSHCSYTSDKRIPFRKHMRRQHPDHAADSPPQSIAEYNLSVSDLESIINGESLKEMTTTDHTTDLSLLEITVAEIEKILTQPQTISCSICDLSFKTQYLLKRHRATQHAKDKNSLHKCAKCEFSTNNKAAYHVHLHLHGKPHTGGKTKSHTGGKTFSCDKCEYTSQYASNMMKHKRVHTAQKILRCTQCNYRTYKEENITRHMQAHADAEVDPVMKCMECPFETTDLSAMQEHTEMHIIGNEFIDNSIHDFLPNSFVESILS